jgi:hypothetical protein
MGLAFSGNEQNKNYWSRIAFGGNCTDQYLDRHFYWKIPGIIKKLGDAVDLSSEQRCVHFAALSSQKNCFYVPVSVEGELVPDSINFSAHGVKADVKRIEKGQFSYEIETDLAFLKDFCNCACSKHLKKKYQGEYKSCPFRQVTNGSQQIEGLFITRNNQRVAGILMCFKNETVSLKCCSVMPEGEALIKQGVMQAIYYFVTVYLKEKGVKHISYGGTRPFLCDGVMVWKKKWGLQLSRAGALAQKVRIMHDRPGVRSFLQHNPCIVTERSGLSGVAFIEGRDSSDVLELKKMIRYGWTELNHVAVYCFDQIPELDSAENEMLRFAFKSAGPFISPPAANPQAWMLSRVWKKFRGRARKNAYLSSAADWSGQSIIRTQENCKPEG